MEHREKAQLLAAALLAVDRELRAECGHAGLPLDEAAQERRRQETYLAVIEIWMRNPGGPGG